MKALHALAVLGALAAAPALAQQQQDQTYPSGEESDQLSGEEMRELQRVQRERLERQSEIEMPGRQSQSDLQRQEQQQLGSVARSIPSEQAVDPQFLAQIQQQLHSYGYYNGPVDGVYGEQTRQALTAWQQDQGLRATGTIDGQTITAMGVTGQSSQQAQTPSDGQRSRRLEDDQMRGSRAPLD